MEKEVTIPLLREFYQQLNDKKSEIRAIAILIFPDDRDAREDLDEKPYNHATAFNYLALKEGLEILKTTNPLEAGRYIAGQGTIAIQIRDDVLICYFPSIISNNQYFTLEKNLINRDNLNYQFEQSDYKEGFVKKEIINNN